MLPLPLLRLLAECPIARADDNNRGDVLMVFRQVGDIISFVQLLPGEVGAVVQVVAVCVHCRLASGVPQRRYLQFESSAEPINKQRVDMAYII